MALSLATNDALTNPLGHWLWALPLVKPQLALGLTGISSCVTDVWTPHVRFDLDLAVDSLTSCWRQTDAAKSFSGIILILNIQEISEND